MQGTAAIYTEAQFRNWGIVAHDAFGEGTVRGITLAVSTLQNTLKQRAKTMDDLFLIACDTLVLDCDLIIGTQLDIVARHIEVKGDPMIGFDKAGSRASLVVRSMGGATANLTAVSLVDQNHPKETPIALLDDGRISVLSLEGNGDIKVEGWSPDSLLAAELGEMLQNDELLYSALVSTFQCAVIISSVDLELAREQLLWVAELADSQPSSRSLAAQARVELTTLLQEQHGVTVVPPGDFSIYADAAKARLEVMKHQWDRYKTWSALQTEDENWLRQARQTLEFKANDADLCVSVLQRAKAVYDSAETARKMALTQLKMLEMSFISASNDFEAGIEIWKQKAQTFEALLLVKNIAILTAEAGKIVFFTATATSGATINTKKLKSAGGELPKAVAAGADIVRNAIALIEIEKTAQKLHSAATETLKSLNNALGSTIRSGPLDGLDVVTGGSQVWDAFLVSINLLFKTQEEHLRPIEGSQEYEVALRKLVIGAEAVGKARLAEAQAANEVVLASLHLTSARNAQKIADRSLTDFQQRTNLSDRLRQEAFGRLLDTKRAIFVELNHYRRAIAYFSLVDHKTCFNLPQITAPVEDFVAVCAELSGYRLAIDLLKPVPQVADRIAVNVELLDTNRMADGSLVFDIDLDHPDLQDFSRIRIDRIDIELEDQAGNRILVKTLEIATNGTYRDRKSDRSQWVFCADPWRRLIHFDKKGRADVNAESYSRFAQLVFKPTPFTTWLIQLKDRVIADQVARINMFFSGEISSG